MLAEIICFIVVLTVFLVTALFRSACNLCTSHVITGGQEKTESADTQNITKDNMENFIKFQTTQMSPELASAYRQAFIDGYSAFNAPPIVTLDDIKGALKYEPVRMFKPSIHVGQRKLFNTELQFFTEVLPTGPVTCVYAGAAPSNHTGFLSSLFPEVKFILVDPNPFDIFEAKPVFLHRKSDPKITVERANLLINQAASGDQKIYIINDLMTMEIAEAVAKNIPGVYFISDIRTNVTDGIENPDATDILWNLSQQFNWMSVMKPRQSMLKFRHPFYSEDPEVFARKQKEEPYATDFALSKKFGIDFAANYETKKLSYWDGIINIQSFPGPSSTETRLITDGKKIRDWGTPNEYENKLFYYNSIARCYQHHVNGNTDTRLGFDNCNDCALENLLWTNYIKKYNSKFTVKQLVAKLSQITHRPLIRGNHGRFFNQKYPLKQLTACAQVYQNNPTAHPEMFPQATRQKHWPK